MNKTKFNMIFLTTLLLTLFFNTYVYADSPECHAELDSYTNRFSTGEEFIYNIGTMGAASNTYINSLHYIIEYDKNDLEVVEINGKYAGAYNDWNINAIINDPGLRVNFITVDAFTDDVSKMYHEIISDKFVKIAYIKFKVKSSKPTSTSIILKKDSHGFPSLMNDISYYTHIFESDLAEGNYENSIREAYNSHTTVVNIFEKDANAELSSLTINHGNLDSEFNSKKTFYSAIVDNEISTILIEGISSKESSKVSGIGLKELQIGDNQFDIVVTAENGNTQIYTLNVLRKEKKEIFLKTCTIENLELFPNFDPNIHNYVIITPYEVESLDFKYTLNDNTNNIEIINNENLKVGKNEVTLELTNSDKTTTTNYNFLVLKQEKKEIPPQVKDYSHYYIVGLLILGIISIIEFIIILKKEPTK